MMMSNSEQTQTQQRDEAAAPKPAALNVGSVADLERRLAAMGSPKNNATAAPPTVTTMQQQAPVVAKAVAPPAMKGGKNALLARIMAAKEKQEKKNAPTPPPPAPLAPPPPTADLLTDFDAPSTNNLPPPSYETNFLKDVPPPAFETMAPPAFDVMEHQQQQQMEFLPPPPMDSLLPPPPPLNDVLPPPQMPHGDFLDFGMPSASAPMFEDLHTQQPPPQEFHPPPLPPPMEAAPPELDIDESILNALEPAEREAFLDEQRKILEQIELEKSNIEASGAAARAIAFDQRSSNAVANVAASYERGGPQPSATTVDFGAVDSAQMLADAELAEMLQKEEYQKSEQRRSGRSGGQRSGRQSQSSSSEQPSAEGGKSSWYDWLTGAPASAPATRAAATSGVSSRSSPSRSGTSRGLVSAVADESVGLMSGGGNGPRVADPNKSMFSCVADSMGTAVTQMYHFQSDEEGNVHGVDSQGLLAMPDVSRQREN